MVFQVIFFKLKLFIPNKVCSLFFTGNYNYAIRSLTLLSTDDSQKMREIRNVKFSTRKLICMQISKSLEKRKSDD